MQAARQAALPASDELRRRLQAATSELPLRADRLQPFVADVEAARTHAPLQRADLERASVAEAVDALLMHRGDVWSAVLPLRPPVASAERAANDPANEPAIDPARIRAALAGQRNEAGAGDPLFIDVGTETQALYAAYLRQAIGLSLAGLAAIVMLLLVALRSAARVARVLAPLMVSVLVVVASIAASGKQLTIMHLIGMLLIVAIGSNYALFFDQRAHSGGAAGGSDAAGDPGGERARMLASLLCANLTTVAGFGLLAFSSVPVLQAIGITVGPGAILALVFSALLVPVGASRHSVAR